MYIITLLEEKHVIIVAWLRGYIIVLLEVGQWIYLVEPPYKSR